MKQESFTLSNLQSSSIIAAICLFLATTSQAFTASPLTRLSNQAASYSSSSSSFMTTPHRSGFSTTRNNLHPQQLLQGNKAFRRPLQAAALVPETTDEEVERLQAMAAKLRAEAAALQAEQQQAFAQAATKAFAKFDVNRDGHIDLDELRAALEKTFKLDLSSDDQPVVLQKVMSKFDMNGDGVLTPDEFVVGIDQIKNQLDQVNREQKEQSRRAVIEQEATEQVTALLQAQIELMNDGKPSVTDKIVSTLPYLFPLLDGLQYARFFVLDNPDSPLALAAGVLYGLYRSIPFAGFLAFFALSFFSNNLSLNRLVRFNMQQAIYLDIALFVPGLLLALASTIAGGGAAGAAAALVQQLGSDGVFLSLLTVLAYTTVSSLIGKEPDKIPFISNAVKRRMPTIEMFLDAQGRFSRSSSRAMMQPPEQKKKPDDDDDDSTNSTADAKTDKQKD
jgi:Chloroplast import apparatus Tic20-like/EF-hand domain pair